MEYGITIETWIFSSRKSRSVFEYLVFFTILNPCFIDSFIISYFYFFHLYPICERHKFFALVVQVSTLTMVYCRIQYLVDSKSHNFWIITCKKSHRSAWKSLFFSLPFDHILCISKVSLSLSMMTGTRCIIIAIISLVEHWTTSFKVLYANVCNLDLLVSSLCVASRRTSKMF